MTIQAEHEENSNAADDSTPPSYKERFRMPLRLKLKPIANYAVDGIVPAVAVIALIVAVMAINGNKSSHTQLGQNAAMIENLSASLAVSRNELEKLKAEMAQEKSSKEAENKTQDERMVKVVQNLNQLQVKMKVSPTLDEQLQQSVMPQVIGLTAVPVAGSAATGTATDKKPGSQAQVLTEAIDKFNKKSHK